MNRIQTLVSGGHANDFTRPGFLVDYLGQIVGTVMCVEMISETQIDHGGAAVAVVHLARNVENISNCIGNVAAVERSLDYDEFSIRRDPTKFFVPPSSNAGNVRTVAVSIQRII